MTKLFYSSEYSIDSNEDEGLPLTQEELRVKALKGVYYYYLHQKLILF